MDFPRPTSNHPQPSVQPERGGRLARKGGESRGALGQAPLRVETRNRHPRAYSVYALARTVSPSLTPPRDPSSGGPVRRPSLLGGRGPSGSPRSNPRARKPAAFDPQVIGVGPTGEKRSRSTPVWCNLGSHAPDVTPPQSPLGHTPLTLPGVLRTSPSARAARASVAGSTHPAVRAPPATTETKEGGMREGGGNRGQQGARHTPPHTHARGLPRGDAAARQECSRCPP